MVDTAFVPRSRIPGFLLLLSAWLALPSPAAGVTVRVGASPRQLTVADTFRLQVEVAGVANEVNAPELREEGFRVVSQSQQSSISIFGGRESRSITFVYVLRPTRTGVLSIPPISVRVGNAVHTSRDGVSVTVTEIPKRDDFILELSASREKLYVEQEITVTLKIYARRLSGSNATLDPFASGARGGTWPQLEIPWFRDQEGFEAEDWQSFIGKFEPRGSGAGFPVNNYTTSQGFFRESLVRFTFPRTTERRSAGAGDREYSYFVYTLEKTFRAEVTGERVFEPVTARGTIFRDRGDGTRPRGETFLTRSESLRVRVLEVPREGRPPTYTGGIGRFAISARFVSAKNRETVWVGEPVTLHLTVTGQGKLESIGPIPLKSQKAVAELFRIHEEPEIGEIDPEGRSKTFVYGIRPKSAEIDAIPPIEFSYFDPDREEFVTIATAPVPIDVEEGEGVDPSKVVIGTEEREFTRRLRRIKKAVYSNYDRPDALEPQQPRDRIAPLHIGLFVAPPVVYALLLWFQLRRRRLHQDPRLLRARGALRRARSALEAAAAEEREGHAAAAYQAVARALTGFIADRLALPSLGLTPAEALRHLSSQELPPDEQVRIREVLETCEQARYGATGPGRETPAELIGTSRDLLRVLDRVLK